MENAIKAKSYGFAIRIIKAYKYLNSEQKEFILSKQMLRSGTAVGRYSGKLSMLNQKQILFIS